MSQPPPVGIWPIPIALGIVTCVGLVAGLLADGLWDAVSWLGLGVPVAVVVWCSWLAPRGDQKSSGRGR